MQLAWITPLRNFVAEGKGRRQELPGEMGVRHFAMFLLRRDIGMSVYLLRQFSRECKTNRTKKRMSGLMLSRPAELGPKANSEGLAVQEHGGHITGRKAGCGCW